MAQARLEQTHAPRIFVSALALQPPELPDGRAPALLHCARRVYSYPRTISTAFPPPSDATDPPLSQRGRRGRDRAWNALEPHRRSYFSDARYAITWLSARPGADVCEWNTKCPVSGCSAGRPFRLRPNPLASRTSADPFIYRQGGLRTPTARKRVAPQTSFIVTSHTGIPHRAARLSGSIRSVTGVVTLTAPVFKVMHIQIVLNYGVGLPNHGGRMSSK
ncbi:hypothetical protein C2E23DRAFT_399099 [Lenzites betulinus]|nr:hypothetical protein C2E23DRAFT_399099 [Lenzites betulinus]